MPTLDNMKGYKMQNTTAATIEQITDVLINAGFTFKGKQYGEGFEVWDATSKHWPSRERFGNPNAIDTMTVTRYVSYCTLDSEYLGLRASDLKVKAMSEALTAAGITHDLVDRRFKSIQIVLSTTVMEKEQA